MISAHLKGVAQRLYVFMALIFIATSPGRSQSMIPEDPSVHALKKLHPVLVEYVETMGILPVDLTELKRLGFVQDARVLFPPRSLAAILNHSDHEGLTPWRVVNRKMDGYVLVSDEARDHRVYALHADGHVEIFRGSLFSWYGSWQTEFDIPKTATGDERGITIKELSLSVFEVSTGKERPAVVIHGSPLDDFYGSLGGSRLLNVGGHQVTTVRALKRFLTSPAGRRLARAPLEVIRDGEIVQVGLQRRSMSLPLPPRNLLPEGTKSPGADQRSTRQVQETPTARTAPRSTPDESTTQASTEARPSKELVEAAKGGDLETVRRLLKTGADVESKDSRGQNALLHASYKGHLGVVQELIRAGADVNMVGSRGETPLLAAADGGNPEVLKALIAAGGNRDYRNDGGATLLAAAANRGDIETIRTILDLGVDVNANRCFRRGIRVEATALMIAASRRRDEAVSFLLRRGAAVDSVGDQGMTALMAAAEARADSVVSLLLASGADPRLVDERGRTALAIAKDRESERSVRLLESAMRSQ